MHQTKWTACHLGGFSLSLKALFGSCPSAPNQISHLAYFDGPCHGGHWTKPPGMVVIWRPHAGSREYFSLVVLMALFDWFLLIDRFIWDLCTQVMEGSHWLIIHYLPKVKVLYYKVELPLTYSKMALELSY